MKTLCKDVGNYSTCSLYDFPYKECVLMILVVNVTVSRLGIDFLYRKNNSNNLHGCAHGQISGELAPHSLFH